MTEEFLEKLIIKYPNFIEAYTLNSNVPIAAAYK